MSALALSVEDELEAFERGALDPSQFSHREHVRFAYEMLGRHSFGDAVNRFSRGLKRVAGKAGHPEVYHETITVAFLAVISERRSATPHSCWPEFIARNQDLLNKSVLRLWYSADQLTSDLARKTFCLPRH